jgi:hypothetical protein
MYEHSPYKYMYTYPIHMSTEKLSRLNLKIHIYVHPTPMSNHPYEYMYAHPTHMSTCERLSRLDLKIHKIDRQKCLTVDRYVTFH